MSPPHDFISVENIPLILSPVVIYVGVQLDHRLKFRHDILGVKTRFIAGRNSLYPLLYKNSHLPLSGKLLRYTFFLRPLLTYDVLCWVSAAKTHVSSLFILQNKVLEATVNAP